jgi:hypothetical protein
MNYNELKVNDRVFEIYKKYRSSGQKISMTDDQGVRWHRYENSDTEFAVKELIVVGIMTPVIEGVNVYGYNKEVYFKDKLDDEYVWYIDDTAEYVYLLTEEEANNEAKRLNTIHIE